MPIEYVVLAAVAAVAAVVVGIWLGKRPQFANRSRAVGALPPATTIVPAQVVVAVAPEPGASAAELGAQLEPTDHLGIGLVQVGPSGIVETANAAAAELLGWRQRGLVGKTMIEAFLDHGVEDLVARARADGHASTEYVLSAEPPKTLSLHAWRANDGGMWIALTDVSELTRLRRIRTEFVGNLSHELRTPLTTMRLLTESLLLDAERTDLPQRVRDSIAKIDVETGHLVTMVNELLDLAKIEQGDAPIRRDAVDITRVAEESVSRLTVFAERKGVTLRTEVEADRRAVVTGDEDRLGQLLANLIHNAIKFSPAGATVVVRVRDETENVIVEVEDNGPGIPPEDRNRIFERFYKVDRARSRGRGGTGLGLAIARHIVDRHRGHIWVQSTEGTGSTFFVSLPKPTTQPD